MKISEMEIGQKATVVAVNLSKNTCATLYEVGLTEGAEVELVRIAGFNGPYELYVRGFHLAIRKCDAENIVVKI